MKTLKKQILYDIKTAYSQNKRWCIICIVLCFLITWRVYREYSYVIKEKQLGFSWLDCILAYFRGVEKISLFERDQIVRIPVEWFLFHFGYLFLEIKYPYTDCMERGYQFVLRSKSRKNWWISKCVWTFFHTGIYFLLFYIITFLGTYILEGEVLKKDTNIWGILINGMEFHEKVVLLVVLPYVVAAALSFLAMVISFLGGTLLSFIVILILLVASVYWDCPLLIPKYSMICRYDLLNGMDDDTVLLGMILSGITIFLSAVGGYFWYKQKEFLEEQ